MAGTDASRAAPLRVLAPPLEALDAPGSPFRAVSTHPPAALPPTLFSLEIPVTTGADAVPAEALATIPPASSAAAGDAATQVHLHVEMRGTGAVVWLGVPVSMLDALASNSDAMAAWVVQARRALAARGIDAQQVILNGCVAWTASTLEANDSPYRPDRPTAGRPVLAAPILEQVFLQGENHGD